ncbi:DUF3306 domain-containing protein [Vibrio sinensis]|uniref:DUF3306 domain-containing protein n=1 Tax=Vibrio sinensis TaxID=2302434 RepID=A0A3A6QKN5_9VIBR|nr:DUF3306 domain-containing protein [Vibrio sinensis]RJX66454.1 DUF3306 domain-containing protein [Vibrio sinensis]
MATSFLSRWSKRKLDETKQDDVTQEEVTDQSNDSVVSSDITSTVHDTNDTIIDGNKPPFEEASIVSSETEGVDTDEAEKPSIAALLASEASASVKKAALRKLFLSEEFNIRDGLDDYDEDYSQLKTLTEGVAETLRDWVKEKTEEEPEEHAHDSLGDEVAQKDTDIAEDEKELDINTVYENSEQTEQQVEILRQNIPNQE